MTLGVIGTDFRNSSIQFRELIYFDAEMTAQFLAEVRNSGFIDECVVLSTCNRVEIYFVAQEYRRALDWIIAHLAELHGLDSDLLAKGLTARQDDDMVHHLFRVVSGLESMVLGENEILGQIKAAYQVATEHQITGPYLNKLFQKCVGLGKRVREETGVSKGAYSVSSIAVDQIRQNCPEFFGQRLLIVGAGTMAIRALKKLDALGHPDLTITNRTKRSADRLAEQFGIASVALDETLVDVSTYDILLVATGAKSYILDAVHFSKSTYVVDLGMPRNVDPAVEALDHVTLVPVDGLLAIANRNLETRQRAYEPILHIIAEEQSDFVRWMSFRHQLCVSG